MAAVTQQVLCKYFEWGSEAGPSLPIFLPLCTKSKQREVKILEYLNRRHGKMPALAAMIPDYGKTSLETDFMIPDPIENSF